MYILFLIFIACSVLGYYFYRKYCNKQIVKKPLIIDNEICDKCGFYKAFCVGHFGSKNNDEIIYHEGYMKYVEDILSCVVIKPSKMLIYKNEEEIKSALNQKTPKERLKHIRNITKDISYLKNPNFECEKQIPKIKINIKDDPC